MRQVRQVRQPIKFNKTANRMLVLCLSHLSHLSQRRLPHQKNNSQIGRFRACLTCLSGLHGGFQVKKQPNWSVLCLSHLSHLSQCLKGTSLPLKKKRPVSMVEKTVKNGWFRVCLTCLRCCLDCLNSRFHAARRSKMAGFMFVSVASVVPTQGFMQQNNQKMDVLWSQLFPLQVSCKKKSKKSLGLCCLTCLTCLTCLSETSLAPRKKK